MENFKEGDPIICIQNGHSRLTFGKQYIVVKSSNVRSNPQIYIINDNGYERIYNSVRFRLDIECIRNEVIDEILV